MEDAKREIHNQKMAALIDVKNQVGGIAIEIAEKILKKELDKTNGQEQFVTELLEEVKLN